MIVSGKDKKRLSIFTEKRDIVNFLGWSIFLPLRRSRGKFFVAEREENPKKIQAVISPGTMLLHAGGRLKRASHEGADTPRFILIL